MKIKQKQLSVWCVSLCVAFTIFGGQLSFDSSNAYAQKKDQSKSKRKGRRIETIPAKLVKDFEKVNEAMEAENFAEAEKYLNRIETKGTTKGGKLNNITRAYLYNFRGTIAATNGDSSNALIQFKKILDIKEGVPDGFYNQIVYVVAQVYFSQENYREALKYAQRWFKLQEDPPADAYMLIGQAQYALKDYDNALFNVQKGIQKYIDLGSQPKEGWLNLLNGIYREKKDYKKMVPVLEQLVKYYPKKRYLITLGGVYNELGDTTKMTGIYQALYDQGLLDKEPEIVTLASLQLSQSNPHAAALILQKGFQEKKIKDNLKNNSLYSQALYLARDYSSAIAPLEKAAKLSKNGKIYEQLAQSYLALNEWAKADAAFTKALNKGGLSNKGQVLISQGMSRFEQNKFKSARQLFVTAAKYEKTAAVANQWIKYVDSEVAALEYLNQKDIKIETNIAEKLGS